MPFVFAPPQQPVVPIQDERYTFFPIHRVYGVAKNYAEPGTQVKDVPFFFMKPADTVAPVAEGECLTVPMPSHTNDLKHEIELVAALGKGGRNMTLEEAAEAVWGWCVGIDFTLGDQKMPSGANDITRAKSFERAAPVGYIRPAYRCPMPAPADLWLYINNRKRQGGSTEHLILSPLETIVELSKYWELRPGDLIFTGTPGGAASVQPGDLLKGGVNGVGSIEVKIV